MKAKYRTYIHYGSNTFKPELLRDAKEKYTRYFKPGGLWGSPTDAKLGWKSWCEAEEFRTDRLNKGFRFRLKKTAKVLHLHSFEDAKKYLKGNGWECELDTEKIYKHFDAMELHICDDWNNFRFNNVFYTWDVDSICVWNPDVIVPCGVV